MAIFQNSRIRARIAAKNLPARLNRLNTVLPTAVKNIKLNIPNVFIVV